MLGVANGGLGVRRYFSTRTFESWNWTNAAIKAGPLLFGFQYSHFRVVELNIVPEGTSDHWNLFQYSHFRVVELNYSPLGLTVRPR